MAAYIVGQLKVQDWNWYKEYRSVTEALVTKHGGKYLIKGGSIEHLEGSGPEPSAVVLIEFPSHDHARAWYQDPDYAPMIDLRNRSGVATELFLADGIHE